MMNKERVKNFCSFKVFGLIFGFFLFKVKMFCLMVLIMFLNLLKFMLKALFGVCKDLFKMKCFFIMFVFKVVVKMG